MVDLLARNDTNHVVQIFVSYGWTYYFVKKLFPESADITTIIPAGHVKYSESLGDAIERELFEELFGVKLKSRNEFNFSSYYQVYHDMLFFSGERLTFAHSKYNLSTIKQFLTVYPDSNICNYDPNFKVKDVGKKIRRRKNAGVKYVTVVEVNLVKPRDVLAEMFGIESKIITGNIRKEDIVDEFEGIERPFAEYTAYQLNELNIRDCNIWPPLKCMFSLLHSRSGTHSEIKEKEGIYFIDR